MLWLFYAYKNINIMVNILSDDLLNLWYTGWIDRYTKMKKSGLKICYWLILCLLIFFMWRHGRRVIVQEQNNLINTCIWAFMQNHFFSVVLISCISRHDFKLLFAVHSRKFGWCLIPWEEVRTIHSRKSSQSTKQLLVADIIISFLKN